MLNAAQFLVLTVDDNAAGRYVKTRILSRQGYRVIEAANGRQALAQLERRPDLVLLDVRLPDINGIEVCRAIKSSSSMPSLVLQTSAFSTSTADRISALQAGADGYLVEPAEPEELLAVVNALLRLREAERQLSEARREAERANTAKSRFLAAASHDLRQPLQASRLFLALLTEKLTSAEQQDMARRISDSLEASESLLKVLMDVSALDAGDTRLEIGPVELAPLVERVANDFRAEAEAKGLSLRCKARNAVVLSDPVQLERMLRNLLSNAVRYTERGRIFVACRQLGRTVRIDVMDTGIGIPEADHTEIFSEFYQVGNSERNRAKGLGLGLAVVARLGALLGHAVTVRSREGRGSCFRIALKVADGLGEVKADGAAEGADLDLSGRLALVVEDDPAQLQGLSMLLESWGCQVVGASSAREAADRFSASAQPPSVVITDYRLPDAVMGLDLLDELHRLAGRPLPGLVQTGDTDPRLVEQIKLRGHCVLHKPYGPAGLRSALAECLGLVAKAGAAPAA